MAQEINICERLGVNSKWPTYRSVLARLEKGVRVNVEFQKNTITEYVTREDSSPTQQVPNRNNVTDYTAAWLGSSKAHEILATSLDKPLWLVEAAYWVRYYQVGVRQKLFWHHRFNIIFPDHHHGGLRMFNIRVASQMMALMALLGWRDAVTYQGYLTHAALNRGYQLELQYREQHRRAQAFILRLFADWVGDVAHTWPAYAYDEPIYDSLILHWRTPNADELVPCLLAACDRHTHQTGVDSSKNSYDFSTDWRLERVPLEILFLFRLREWEGLSNPILDHPLMSVPFDRLPPAQPIPELDDLMLGVLKRAHEDWPQYDEVLSLHALKA